MRRSTLVFLLIVLATAGCAYTMPPQKIPLDRRNYLDAVSTSWKEQLLSNLVRLRYGESLTSLEMTSVTTSYELDAGLSAGDTVSWGAMPNNVGFRNAAPLGATLAYSDKPTITYVPVRGEALAQTMIEPLNPLKILKSLQTGWKANYVFPCSVKSINDLRSPSDVKFFEFAILFQNLKQRGAIRIAAEEPVVPKVTKVPDEYTVTLKDKRKEAGTGAPGVEDGTKPKPCKTCEDETDKKKADKEDSEIGFLVVDNDRANEEDSQCNDLKDCVSKSLCYCAWSTRLQDCVSDRLKYLGFDLPCAHSKYLNICANSDNSNNYVSTNLKECAKDETLINYVSKSLDACANNSDLDRCMSDHLNNIVERVTLEEQVSCFKNLLWPKYNAHKSAWLKSYNTTCVECHKAHNINPKYQTCDLDRQITKIVTCGHGNMKKIDDMKPSELKEIISYLEHSSGGYEVYKIIDANQKLPLDPYCDKIVLQTQSILQTLTALSRLINVPGEHTPKAEGKRYDYEELAATLKLTISSAKQCPANAFVAIPYRGYWFYIDDNDYESKDAFSSTQGIFSMSETGTKEGTPILTLPVQ
jgi:hypothetical protein